MKRDELLRAVPELRDALLLAEGRLTKVNQERRPDGQNPLTAISRNNKLN